MTDESASTASPDPFLRIVRGDATPEEIAALVAVLAAVPSPAAPPTRTRPAWSHPARAMRPALHPGRGGWRTSALPH